MKKTFNNPDSQEREYTRLLLRYSKLLQRNVNLVLIPMLGQLLAQYKREIRGDAWVDAADSTIAELDRMAAVGAVAVVDKLPGQFAAVSKFNESQFKMVVKSNTGLPLPAVMHGAPASSILGVNVFRSEPFLQPLAEGWVSENTSLIKSLPARLHPELEGIVRRGVMNGQSVKDITKQIRARYDVTDYRAKLIAQDQTLKLNADLTRYRLQSVGVTKYIWRSVQDSRVRPEHVELNGKEFSFDKPPAEGNPGRPVRCRCRAEAIWDDEDDTDIPQPEVTVPTPPSPTPAPKLPREEEVYQRIIGLETDPEVELLRKAKLEANVAYENAHLKLSNVANQKTKETDALFAEYYRTGRVVSNLSEKLRNANKELKRKRFESLFLPVEERAKRAVYTNEIPAGMKARVLEADEIVKSLVRPDRLPKVRVDVGPLGRPSYMDGAISVNKKTTMSVIVHEMVHDIEDRHKWVLKKTSAFLRKRAGGLPPVRLDKLVPNVGYGPREIAFEDQWKQKGGSHYMGKVYSDATEVLTMGVERLISDPLDFAQKDPEYFKFLIKTLQGDPDV